MVGLNDSSEINGGKILIKLRDKVVLEGEEVEDDALLVDDVEKVAIVVKIEVDEEKVVE